MTFAAWVPGVVDQVTLCVQVANLSNHKQLEEGCIILRSTVMATTSVVCCAVTAVPNKVQLFTMRSACSYYFILPTLKHKSISLPSQSVLKKTMILKVQKQRLLLFHQTQAKHRIWMVFL